MSVTQFIIPATDTEDWNGILSRFDEPDIYSAPHWAMLHANDGDPVLAVAHTARSTLAVPLTLRPLPPPLQNLGWRDAESPYGYPGVLFVGNQEDLRPCLDGLALALQGVKVANAFFRLNPFQDLTCVQALLIGAPHPTVFIPLAQGRAAAFTGPGCHTHRSQVRRALRDGLRVRKIEAPTGAQWQAFQSMYWETMDRLGAQTSYYFPIEYFEKFSHYFMGQFTILQVVDPEGRVEVQAIFLAGPRFAHYHLSCRREEAHNAASSLMFETAADWAAAKQLCGIHLGGGTTASPDDSLYKFKKSIGKGRSEFRIAGLVTDPEGQAAIAFKNGNVRPGRFQFYR